MMKHTGSFTVTGFRCWGWSVLLLLAVSWAGAGTNQYWAYVGTYTGKGSEGIYVARYDAGTGELSPLKLAAVLPNPCFLAVRPDDRSLITASDVATNGQVASLAINHVTGALTPLNTVSAGSRGICHVSFDATGRYALAASYGSGQVFTWRVAADGRLGELTAKVEHHGRGPNPARQASPHAHQIVTAPGNRFVFVCDLGLDKVMAYRLDGESGALTATEPAYTAVAPGAGPRHLVFSPNGRFAYVINEIGSTVTAFAYTAVDGRLHEVGTVSTLPPGDDRAAANTAAEVAVNPSGDFLYASNRGDDSIALFRVNRETGRLTSAGYVASGGRTPRFFTLDPPGKHLLVGNQDSGNLVIFDIDGMTGRLAPTGQKVKLASPVSVVFVPVAEGASTETSGH